MQTSAPDAPVLAVVVTVHGTFARGAPWTRADSALSIALRREFGDKGQSARVEPFEWSGRNTIRARQKAGEALAERLDAITQAHPQAKVLVVAHSHGGSVFAYAMKHRPQLVERVTGFVALATPWLGVDVSVHAIALRAMLARMALVVGLGLLLLSLAYLVRWGVMVSGLSSGWGDTEIGRMARHDQALRWVALFSAGAGLLVVPVQRWMARSIDSRTDAFLNRLERQARAQDTLRTELPASAFFKPIGDEAALALNWAGAMAVLMRAASGLLFAALQKITDLWHRVPPRGRTALSILLTVFWCMGSIGVVDLLLHVATGALPLRYAASELVDMVQVNLSLLKYWDSGLLSWQSVLFSVAMAVALLVAELTWILGLLTALALAFLLFMILLTGWGLGATSFSTWLYLHVLVEATPAGQNTLDLIEVRAQATNASHQPSHGLIHSAVYDHPAAIDAVTAAINRFERSGPAPTRA